MINIQNLNKSFGSHNVLKGISADILPGSVTAVIGPNGSGKSTLMKCILGLCRHDGGKITINGIRVDDRGDHKKIIGYMPQSASFPDNLTGREVLRIIEGIRDDVQNPDYSLIDDFNLRPELDKPVKTLSGGNRQKISAVIAFAFKPRLLLLDEPTAGLDPLSSSVLKDRIHQLKSDGVALLLTSHVLAEIDEMADNILYLLDGRVKYRGLVSKVKEDTGQEKLERAIARLSQAS